jgi:hypothetical protein
VLPPPGTPSRTNDGTPPEGERSGLAEAGEALLAAIRRNAAPDFWADPPGDATLAQRNGVVIARASSDVHDAIGEYLEERRHAALDAALPTGPSPDRTSTEEETRAAVRALRAGAGDLLRRDRELGAIVRALLGDDPEQATSLLDAYLVREPESELAASWKEALLEHPERATSIGVAAREVQARWRRATRVDEWLWQVPAPRAFASIAGPLDRLGRDRLRCRGDALRELLERGSITVETEHASVYEILREIQIQTFVQIVYRPADAWNLDRRTVPRFSVVGRTLREVMDRVVETAAPDQDLTWTANPRCLVLRPAGDQAPPMLLRFYDVRDLLADPQHPASGTEPSAAGPPIPPTYVASEDGEPVLLTPRETEVERERAAAAAIDASAPSASGR